MRYQTLTTLLACVCAAATVEAGWFSKDKWTGECVSDFAVKATMDSFTGKATSDVFVVIEDADELRVDVPVAKMKTGKGKRDKEMLHMFGAEEFPVISGIVAGDAVRELKASEAGTNDLPFTLVIHGQTNTVVAKVTNMVEAEDARSFDASFPVSLKSFGLKAPSMMLGIINVKDEVLVTSRVTLRKGEAPPAEAPAPQP